MVGTTGAGGTGAGLLAHALATWPGQAPVPPGPALLSAMLVLASALLVGIGVVLAAAAWQVRPGALEEDRPTPAWLPTPVRLASALLLSVSASVTVVAGAGAAPPAAQHAAVLVTPAPDRDTLDAPSPLPVPGWTPTPGAVHGACADVTLVSGRVAELLPERHVVRRGDTLWDLAERHLGPDATPAQVAQEWPRWYAANLEIIGPDPDLLLPGQELVVPGTAGADR
ncbi:hypothetical protein SGUI_1010 [Serinicoccus hydrothermalis]|uniref:LysM domain-containing protein n=1 Tax=Serinicoccus hydrothermalis TaxID=1758689 RepID=A0A1B1NAE7_9MICO|nr:LysM domain-containing protein [Serinicoccus hydrothermalis]ANS78406.1 hypothetical protein SGUI_1010 [Serinicoccus hydrothermalis]